MSQISLMVWVAIVFAVSGFRFNEGSTYPEARNVQQTLVPVPKTSKDMKIFDEEEDIPFKVSYQSQSNGVIKGVIPVGCQCVTQGDCRNVRIGGIPYNEPIPIKVKPQELIEIAPEKSSRVSAITDGSEVIDLRIVNQPGQCPAGQHICCPNTEVVYPGSGGGTPGGPGGVGNGYVTCGSRFIIFLPGYSVEFGEARFGAYPWMATILDKANNPVGAGALVSPNYVLTAAHKVNAFMPGTDMKVRLGEWSTTANLQPYRSVEIAIDKIEIHSGFDPSAGNLHNDIALIRLKQPMALNSFPHIKSVCLPEQDSNFNGKRCWVAGFGKDAFGNGKNATIIREVDLPVVDGNECERLLKTTSLGSQFQLNKKSFICAGGEEGKDACTGDGGSPLVCEADGKWTVVGLVAWGIGCGQKGIPGVYVNVPNYITWIQSKLNT